ncbi:hypothetical protein GYB57_13750 [bacterium]|nr:hypothetical protein [bacterium]
MIGLMACEKEAIESDPVMPGNYSNGFNNELLASRIVNETYAKYSEMTDKDFFNVINPIKNQLVENKQLNSDKSGEAIPLGDIFFFYEGTINAIYAHILDPNDEIDSYFSTFEVPIFEEDGKYFIETSDYNSFYSEILDNIDTEINVDSNQYLILADLSLTNVSSNSATINVMLGVGTAASSSMNFTYTPGGEVHGSNKAGWCGASNTQGVDAMNFISSYLNGLSTTANLVCNANDTKALILKGTWKLEDINQNTTIFGNGFQIGNYYWQSYTNSCIGNNSDTYDNEAQWMNWYNKSTQNLPAVKSYFTAQTGFQDMEFLYAQLFAYSSGNNFANANGRNFHHTGWYFFGKAYCDQ